MSQTPEPQTTESKELPAACQSARDGFSAALLDATPRDATIAGHLLTCADCCAACDELAHSHAELQSTFCTALPSAGFCARVMAALPRSPAALQTSNANGLLAVSAQPARSFWRPMAAAAAAVLVLGAVSGALYLNSRSSGTPDTAAQVVRGELLDAAGQRATALRTGQTYRVVSEAVLSVAPTAKARVLEGSAFTVRAPGEMALNKGDAFFAAQSAAQPIRVSVSAFEARTSDGDLFVSEEPAGSRRGVTIVFDGRAQIQQGAREIPLDGGQIFWAAQRGGGEILTLADVLERMTAEVSLDGVMTDELRAQYRSTIEGYDAELAGLRRELKESREPKRRQDIEDRVRRVQDYRTQHQRRLEDLPDALPVEQIRRGLDGHRAPRTWM